MGSLAGGAEDNDLAASRLCGVRGFKLRPISIKLRLINIELRPITIKLRPITIKFRSITVNA